MSLATVAQFALGLCLLATGGEMLVRGASRLAVAAGISPLVMGLTVVTYGTTSPELAVSLRAAITGQADIALGNVVGSNIFNILFILGFAALLLPLAVSSRVIRLDVPIMIGASLLLFVLALDGRLGHLDGLLLLAGLATYTLFAVRQSRRETAAIEAEYRRRYGREPGGICHLRDAAVPLGAILAGLGLLFMGARWLVEGAVALARAFEVSELIIGLTVVAAGTSLPEVATAIVATLRDEREIAVGNIIGSCLYNIMFILGLASLVAPGGIAVAPAALTFDIPVMIGVAVACLPICFTAHRIARWEGALFLAYYTAYTLYLILAALEHDALPMFSATMSLFVIPLTAITLAVLVLRARR